MYFVDTEFIDDGKTIDLISIGIVSEDGRELYLQSCEFDPKKASQWVKDNVFCYLRHCPYKGSYDLARMLSQHRHGQCIDQQRGYLHRCSWRTRKQIRNEIKAFCDPEQYGKPELWGYYSAYDHVVFCQLFGTMEDLPKGFPMLTYDLRQLLDMKGMQDVYQPEDSIHNALEDARWIKDTWERVINA